MLNNKLDQLQKIYNTFALVETHGDSTIIMGQALNALKIFLKEFNIDDEKKE